MAKGQDEVLVAGQPAHLPPHQIWSISKATSVAEVAATLEKLRSEHDAITERLESTASSHHEVVRQIARLDISRARLGSLAVSARSISHGMLSGASSTAARLSEAVERLDVEQSRVKATLDVVEQVAELKACVLGVAGSMGTPQDFETAAEYLNRASRISEHVIKSGFAQQIVPTAEVPNVPSATLDAAAQSLCRLFLREFEHAVAENDGPRITRFFKMFPLIGRSDVGLEAYGKYVCQGVAARARTNLQNVSSSERRNWLSFANALTKLFEHIAQVIDGHTPLVERHYGVGTMKKVIERLHAEADVQAGMILDTWQDERMVDRKLTEVKSYAFNFLVQSFLPVQKGSAPISRAQSPSLRGTNDLGASVEVDEQIDMKEIDQTLNEITAMLGPWSLYLRFISSRTTVPSQSFPLVKRILKSSQGSKFTNSSNGNTLTLDPPDFILESTLPKKISKSLAEPFNVFSTFFLRRSIEKAFQLEEIPTGLSLNSTKMANTSPPYITSVVDDIMYIVNQVVQRTLSTSQGVLVTSVLSTIGRVLGSDFIGMIQRKLRDECYPKATVQGALPPEDKTLTFMMFMNNLDVAVDYIKRIVKSHSDESSGSQEGWDQDIRRPLAALFPMGRDLISVRRAMNTLDSSFSLKTTDLINDGISVLFMQVVKPRIRPLLVEAFRESDYSSSNSVGDAERDNDEFDVDMDSSSSNLAKTVFGAGWDVVVAPMKIIFTTRNAGKLLSIILNHLSNVLEKRIWSYQGRLSELGAVRLEKDIRDIVNIAMNREAFELRESFKRCMEIVTLMNMDKEEWDAMETAEIDGTSSDMWILNQHERQRARSLINQADTRDSTR